jgi:hypothetical protein
MLALNAEQTRLYVQLRLKKTELIGQQIERQTGALCQFFTHKSICVSADKRDGKVDELITRYENLIKKIEDAVDKESLAKHFELASLLVCNGNSEDTAHYQLLS